MADLSPCAKCDDTGVVGCENCGQRDDRECGCDGEGYGPWPCDCACHSALTKD